MNILSFVKAFIPTFLCLFLGNLIAQMTVLGSFNGPYLEGIIRPQQDFVYLIPILLYAIHAKVIYWLVSHVTLVSNKWNGFLVASAYGGLVFLHANVINMFVLPYWPWQVAISDTVSALLIFGVAGFVCSRLKSKS